MIQGHTYLVIWEHPRDGSPPVFFSLSFWPHPDGVVRRYDYIPPLNGKPSFTEVVPFEAAQVEHAAHLKAGSIKL